MKRKLKTLVLVVLTAVMCTSTCIAVMAAEDTTALSEEDRLFENDALMRRFSASSLEEDTETAPRSGVQEPLGRTTPRSEDREQATNFAGKLESNMSGVKTSNMDNAPAMWSQGRIETRMQTPEENVTIEDGEVPLADEAPLEIHAPNTGAVSLSYQLISGVVLLAVSVALFRKWRGKDRAGLEAA